MTPIPNKPPDPAINYMSARSLQARMFKAMDPLRVGDPGAFCNGTEGHSVLSVVLCSELYEKTSLGRYMVQFPEALIIGSLIEH